MDRDRLAAGIGIAGALAVLALAALPYLLGSPAAVGAYYAVGIAGPPLVALFALIVLIVLLAGVTGRSDPALAAGVGVTVGLFMVALAWEWALAAEASLVGGFTTIDAVRHHRFALAVATLLVPAGAGWYARAVL